MRISERPALTSNRSDVERVGLGRIEVLGRLVEHQHREVGQQCSGHCEPLALPPRQAASAHAYRRRQALRQAREPCGQPDPFEHVT